MRRPSNTNHDAFALFVADVFETAGTLRRYGERIAASAGQTQARWQLLSVVSVGDWTVPMAAERIGTSRQAVQRIANELAEEGLATFDDNPHHRRSCT
jgi:DNA-binding MarR family transcriptional regulator